MMSGEPEPRRSVRSTKGQHKGHPDSLEHTLEPKRRGKKATTKKQAEPEPEEEEEVIRCVCGATSQDSDDPDDPWIACDSCHAWQHNVCVGMSVYDEDLEDVEYYCEQCKPENHKDLLQGIAKGERIWETRRREYEEEKAAEKKQKKGPKKGKKRQSDLQEEPRSSQKSAKSSASPAPEKKTAKGVVAKRKDRHDSADTTTKEPSKLRKVSESQAIPVPQYEPPSDLPEAMSELPENRQGAAKLFHKSLVAALDKQEKEEGYNPTDGASNESRAERLAIAIERAVHDSHPARDEYSKQSRTLAANLKRNAELITRLLNHTLTPPMLAVMTSDDLQTEKQQQETAAAKERSVRQSIIATEEGNGPRYRRTHKGDELIEGDSFVGSSDVPSRPAASSSKSGGPAKIQQPHSRKSSGDLARIDTQQSPTTDFDINKVFSSVKSPTVAHQRRPSGPAPLQGPGVDPDVDRLLEDDGNDSPPYSPTEETEPDVVWRGQVIMAATANFQAVAKHVAGANLANTIKLPWSALLPRKLNVGGRIAINTATEYLCSMRWSNVCDLVVANLIPSTEAGKADFDRVFNYFVSKERWAVIGDKGVGNVKDTYLVPVPAGTGNHPEFLLNLEDNFLPHTRTENTLLLVIVYRNDETTLRKIHGPEWNGSNNKVAPSFPLSVQANTSPSPAPSNFPQRSMSITTGPSFSPTTPHLGSGSFPPQPGPNAQGQLPVHTHQPLQQHAYASAAPAPQPTGEQQFTPELQQQGEARARNILGPFASSPTLAFLMPHAYKMQPNEWHIIRGIMEREPRARDDLAVLGALISKESENRQHQQQQQQVTTQQPAPMPQPTAPYAQGGPSVPHSVSPPIVPQIKGNVMSAAMPAAIPAAMPAAIPAAMPAAPVAIPHTPQPAQSIPAQSAPAQSALPRQTPISLPPIPGMPASVHQSYQAAQAQANQARNVQPSPAAPPA